MSIGNTPGGRTMARLILFLLFVLLSGLFASRGLAYEGDIDFAYMGGAYAMEKAGLEQELFSKFVELLLKNVGMGSHKEVKVKNFIDEKELYAVMKKGRVVMAGVSHFFFKDHEAELDLVP
ncbi:MAG: hypothetical protein HQK59_08010, partial [Deltaproteobacteria bacterium]|nr:hypothetical protein [Deltaproteobacteria bacterium]